jgi:transposase-like protein
MGQRPRRFDAQFKTNVVLDILVNGKSYSEASRECGVKDSVLSRWRQEFVERAAMVFETHSGADPRDAQIAELERMVGRLATELEMVKKARGYLGSLGNRNEPS